jgi:predicted metal-dependent phosphoesterase TrpH
VSGIDLHVHSSVSDGRLSPEAVVGKAAGLGLKVLALTDHDTVDGIAAALEAAKAYAGLVLIPGIEVSTETPGSEVHILGYFIDCNSRELTAALDRFHNSRYLRAQKIIAKLHDVGIEISWQRVQEIAGEGSIGRPHIAQAMLEGKYISSLKEAFDKYIGHNGPAYVERDKMTPVEAVKLIVGAEGLPVLAHPFTIPGREALVGELKDSGLVGLETYYGDYTKAQIQELLRLAEQYQLIPTGGSDYHGMDETSETMLGDVDVPEESVKRLIKLASDKALQIANISHRDHLF